MINSPDFDSVVMILSSIGVILSTKPFIHGIESFGKNSIKYLRRVSKFCPGGILKDFLLGKIPLKDSRKNLEHSKKNEFSIPRTTSCLSNIRNIKHLDTAFELISRYKRTGNTFINLTGDAGLTLYSSLPTHIKNIFIKGFKKNPIAVLGLTKTHLIIHTVKIFKKYDLVSLIIPVTTLSIILSLLPQYLVWIIFIGSTGYLAFVIFRKLKHKFNKRKEN